MKNFITGILIFANVSFAFSQVVEVEKDLTKQHTDTLYGWERGGTISLNLSQVSLTNWASGGLNSISTNGLISLFAHYGSGPHIWQNYLDIGYGTIQQGANANWQKTDDKIDFTSKYGRKAFSSIYYAGLVNFKTQMTDGYNLPDDSTRISRFLAPAYLLAAIGFDYKPNKRFTAFVAPLTLKTTIVNDQTLADAGAFGVDAATYDPFGNILTEGKRIRYELGGYIRMFYTREIMKNVALQSKLDLFSNYMHNPGNIDVSWEVLLSMKVNKYISATITTHLLYDDDINVSIDKNNDGTPEEFGPRTQFKEVIGVGFSYKF